MKKFVFAALTVIAIAWGTASGALQQSPQLEDDGAAGWSITETGSAPGWSITPAHARMW
jgi:hypothetical protein